MLKSFFVLASLLLSLSVAASEVLIFEAPAPRAYDGSDINFLTDSYTKQGFVEVKLYRESWSSMSDTISTWTVFEKVAKVTGLTREGNELVFKSENETTICGTYGYGRRGRLKFFPTNDCQVKLRGGLSDEGTRVIRAFFVTK